jgi:hypothetical protein
MSGLDALRRRVERLVPTPPGVLTVERDQATGIERVFYTPGNGRPRCVKVLRGVSMEDL